MRLARAAAAAPAAVAAEVAAAFDSVTNVAAAPTTAVVNVQFRVRDNHRKIQGPGLEGGYNTKERHNGHVEAAKGLWRPFSKVLEAHDCVDADDDKPNELLGVARPAQLDVLLGMTRAA